MWKWRWSKVVVFALGMAPLLWLLWRAYNHRLSANPVEFITHYTGDWTLRLIVITLCVTPARKVLGRPQLIQFRRMIGLFAFFYASLHFLTYLVIDKFFDWREILTDIGKRTYITVGFTALVILTALAITSTAGSIRRLGGKRWQRLHQLIYVAVVAGVIHYYWSVKSDVRDPIMYGFFAAVLLGYRLWVAKVKKTAGGPRLRKSPEPAVR